MLNQIRYSLLPLLLLAAAMGAPGRAETAPPDRADALHAEFSALLAGYVQDGLVDYLAWHGNPADHQALVRYVDQLSALDPTDWPRPAALAYWLNLYNAVTLRLILDNYPLESIKDLGGFLKKSPWKRELVTVGGRALTLNAIENDIIRPTFAEPRIHFALNCASLGCPPLAAAAYRADRLDAQLDAACERALNRERWVLLDGNTLRLTRIFDWYGADFNADGGSVIDFVRRYHQAALPTEQLKVLYMDYDWSLNQATESEGTDH